MIPSQVNPPHSAAKGAGMESRPLCPLAVWKREAVHQGGPPPKTTPPENTRCATPPLATALHSTAKQDNLQANSQHGSKMFQQTHRHNLQEATCCMNCI